MSASSQPARYPTPSRSGEPERYSKKASPFIGDSDLIAAAVVALGLCWRLWLAHATFFNTDEAWHYSIANQDSLLAAYKASLTLAHPPLLVFILYFWRHLGTSDVMLRLPGVLAGTIFCWVFYKWLTVVFWHAVALVGLIFATFLPPMIALSAELRQYSLMLMFAVSAAYFLERALASNSVRGMLLSCVCLYLAMLSHYSAFLFAASLGVYVILRMISKRPSLAVMACWIGGQALGIGLAASLYETHIAKLSSIYPVAQPLQRFGDFYLSDWYFHAGRDRLLPFLYRGTFGVFRFIFGQTAMGQIAALLFFAGMVLLLRGKSPLTNLVPPRLVAVLLMIPFALNWAAVAAGLYPYGRTRQCIFLAMFALAGVSVALTKFARNRIAFSVTMALVMVAICQVFGTLQGRDMLPLADQRHEHMDEAIQFIRSQLSPGAEIVTDKATSFQLEHYLCPQKPVGLEPPAEGLESFRCGRFQTFTTGSSAGALTAENLAARWKSGDGLGSANEIWVVQAGWARGLGEALRDHFPAFSQLRIHSFGRYIEIFQLPSRTPEPSHLPSQR